MVLVLSILESLNKMKADGNFGNNYRKPNELTRNA